jgi:hypothetical protein
MSDATENQNVTVVISGMDIHPSLSHPNRPKHRSIMTSGWVGEWIEKYTPADSDEFEKQRNDPLVLGALQGLMNGNLEGLLTYLKETPESALSFQIRIALVTLLEGSSEETRFRLRLDKHPSLPRKAKTQAEVNEEAGRFWIMLVAFHEAKGFHRAGLQEGLIAAAKAGGVSRQRADQILFAEIRDLWRPHALAAGDGPLDFNGACRLGDDDIMYPPDYKKGEVLTPIVRPKQKREKTNQVANR